MVATTAEGAATTATAVTPAAKTANSFCRIRVISSLMTRARKKRKVGFPVSFSSLMVRVFLRLLPPMSGAPVPTPTSPPHSPNLAGLPSAPPTVYTFGLPLAPSTRSSGSPSVPTPPPPLPPYLASAPPTVQPAGVPLAPITWSSDSPSVPTPPPPPPWSKCLPAHLRTVTCGWCLVVVGCHGLWAL